MPFAVPSDDGTIELAPVALTDHPCKELFAWWTAKMHILLWAGSVSASAVWNDAPGRLVYLMLKCYMMCAHPMILICSLLSGIGICSHRLVMFCLCVSVPFLFVLLLWASLKAFPGPSSGLRSWLFWSRIIPLFCSKNSSANIPFPPPWIKRCKAFSFGPDLLLVLLVLSR